MDACPHCGECAIVYDGNGTTCCECCGMVLSDFELRNEVELMNMDNSVNAPVGTFLSDLENAPSINKTRSATINYAICYSSMDNAKREMQGWTERIAERLRLSPLVTQQIWNRVDQYTKGKYKRGYGAVLITAACTYITCRLVNLPITLLDVADSINESSFVLGRTYCRIVQDLKITFPDQDPTNFIERALSKFELADKKKLITERSLRLISLAKDESGISTGRRPAAIAAAAIIMAMNASGFTPDETVIIEQLNVAPATVKTRKRELRRTLAKLAIEELPFGKNVNERTIMNHLSVMLQYLEIKARGKENTPLVPPTADQAEEDKKKIIPMSPILEYASLPPSFAKQTIAKQERKKQIAIAKEKLTDIVSSSTSLIDPSLSAFKVKREKSEIPTAEPKSKKTKLGKPTFDEKLFLIERLLLRGVDEKKIEETDLRVLMRNELDENKIIESSDDTEELTSKDLSEAELKEFIRTPEEVKLLQELNELSGYKKNRVNTCVQ